MVAQIDTTGQRPIDLVVSRLETIAPGKWHGEQFKCRCPAHTDKNPSLSVREAMTPQGEATVLLNCFASCSTEDVLAAIGLDFSDIYESSRTVVRFGRSKAEQEKIDYAHTVYSVYHNAINTGRALSADDEEHVEAAQAVLRDAGEDLPEGWPKPLSVTQSLRPAPVDLADVVPQAIARLAQSEGARLNVDPVPIAAHCLGVACAVISDRWAIQLKAKDTMWRQHANLWVASVQVTGSRKNDQMGAAMRPLSKLEHEWREEYRPLKAAWDALDKDAKKPNRSLDYAG